jgi:hypothetical protein
MPKTLPVLVQVRDIPEFSRLYKAVHDYLVAGLRNDHRRKHEAYCDLIDAHDVIAASFEVDAE